MTERPIGPPGAPPRSSSRSRGDDPLSVVLSDSEEEDSPNATSTESWRQLQTQILAVLRKSKKPITIETLAQKVGVGFLPLSEQVLDLARRNEVILRGSPGQEMVSLSPASAK